MKGFILADGTGTRLRPITHTSAKQLVPIANKPILFYGIEGLATASIQEVGFVVGENGDDIRADWGLADPILSERDAQNSRRSDLDPAQRPHKTLRT